MPYGGYEEINSAYYVQPNNNLIPPDTNVDINGSGLNDNDISNPSRSSVRGNRNLHENDLNDNVSQNTSSSRESYLIPSRPYSSFQFRNPREHQYEIIKPQEGIIEDFGLNKSENFSIMETSFHRPKTI